MPFIPLKRTNSEVTIWVNTDQITTITGQRRFACSNVYSDVYTSDGFHMNVDMKPGELLLAIEAAEMEAIEKTRKEAL